MKVKAVVAASLLALVSQGSEAAISRFVGGELFLEVWNGVEGSGGKSYTFDLGKSIEDVLNNPASLNGYSKTVSFPESLPSTAIWTVKASNFDAYAYWSKGGTNPNDPANYTGFATTVRSADQMTKLDERGKYANYRSWSDPMGTVQEHVANINNLDSNNGLNVDKTFNFGDAGYYLEPHWDGRMGVGNTNALDTDAPVSQASMPMYFLTIADYDSLTPVIGHNGQPLGTWKFNGTTLSFTAGDSTGGGGASCSLPWGGTLANGQSVTAYQVEQSANCDAVKETRSCSNGTLSGSFTKQACAKPAVEQACTLPWGGTLASGQSVTAYQVAQSANCDAVKETRACSNGALSGSFTLQACAKTADVLQLRSPNGGESLKVGVKQLVRWGSNGLTSKQKLTLSFSKNNGGKYQVLKSGLSTNGTYTWKPTKPQATTAGLMKICLPKTKTTAEVCDTSDGVFTVK